MIKKYLVIREDGRICGGPQSYENAKEKADMFSRLANKENSFTVKEAPKHDLDDGEFSLEKAFAHNVAFDTMERFLEEDMKIGYSSWGELEHSYDLDEVEEYVVQILNGNLEEYDLEVADFNIVEGRENEIYTMWVLIQKEEE